MGELSVATLNFSGINNSPFEYHDGSPQIKRLNMIFLENAKRYTEVNAPGFSWNVGKIDVVMKKERYSILYQNDVGVLGNKLLSKHEFEVIWKYVYSRNCHLLKSNQPSPSMIELALLFDWIAYDSALKFVYGDDYSPENIKSLNPEPYLSCLSEWHSKSFLNLHKKIQEICEYINNKQLDIFFIQEAGNFSWEPYTPMGYNSITRETSMIFYKQDRVRIRQDKAFDDKYGKLLNFNNDSVYVLCNDNLLVLSIHLTSKQAFQGQQLKEVLQILHRIHSQEGLQIIAGLDANQAVQESGFRQFPEVGAVTTAKKRTMMQFQFHKSDILVEEAKDYLISSFDLKEGKIETITQHESSNKLLPNDDHPFDHFVVSAKIFDKSFAKPPEPEKQEIPVIVPVVLAEFLSAGN